MNAFEVDSSTAQTLEETIWSHPWENLGAAMAAEGYPSRVAEALWWDHEEEMEDPVILVGRTQDGPVWRHPDGTYSYDSRYGVELKCQGRPFWLHVQEGGYRRPYV